MTLERKKKTMFLKKFQKIRITMAFRSDIVISLFKNNFVCMSNIYIYIYIYIYTNVCFCVCVCVWVCVCVCVFKYIILWHVKVLVRGDIKRLLNMLQFIIVICNYKYDISLVEHLYLFANNKKKQHSAKMYMFWKVIFQKIFFKTAVFQVHNNGYSLYFTTEFLLFL